MRQNNSEGQRNQCYTNVHQPDEKQGLRTIYFLYQMNCKARFYRFFFQPVDQSLCLSLHYLK